MDPLIPQILLQILLIALNAIFACAEIAMISLDEHRLKKLANDGDKRAGVILKFTSQPTKFLATIQIGITLAGAFGSALAAENFSKKLAESILSLGVDSSMTGVIKQGSFIVITLLISYLTLVFGELVPKRLAMRNAEKIGLSLSGLINVIFTVATPVVNFLNFSTNSVLKLLGVKNPEADEDEITEEQIRALVDAGSESGNINPEERMMIENIFEFDDKMVSEIMVHRIDMNVLWTEDDLDIWEQAFIDSNNSVLPICHDNIDDVKGTLSLKSFYNAIKQGVKTTEAMMAFVKKPYFVPEYITIDILFQNMQKTKSRFVLVLDEYGGLSGIATINDILEEIVGEFDDETDKIPEIIELEKNKWRVQGTITLSDLNNVTNIKLPEGDYDTLGGYVVSEIKIIPQVALDILPIEKDGYKITIESVNLRRVDSAIIEKIDKSNNDETIAPEDNFNKTK